MNEARNEIIASIARAKLELETALEDVKTLPMVDPMVFGFLTHALNNYLQVTMGTVGLLADELKDDPRYNVGVWLKGLHEVTQRMRHLVQELRTGPREAAPRMHLEKVDLALLVRRASDFYRRIASRKEIEVVFEKGSPILPKVRTDRLAVAAILDNLLSNAVKFSPPGRRIVVRVQLEDGKVVCGVRDEGPGVDPKNRANLFQRGFLARAGSEGHEPGGGFGLAVAAELVASLGGDIGCESEPGKGAYFFFRLPCPQRASRTRLPK